MTVRITHIDTACVLIELNGFRILTDPTLDNAGKWYHHGVGAISQKTGEPALPAGGLENIDLVLLSHHQHYDNLDHEGSRLLATVPMAISTHAAAKKFSNIKGLNDWESISIDTPKVKGLKITATPAQHRPWWLPEFFSGKVIGFIIECEAQDNGAIYISGDTVFFNGIKEVARRFRIDIALFHVGSVQFRYLTGFGRYTMNASDLLKAAHVVNPRTVIPIHHKGWSHFKERETTLRNVIADDAIIQSKTFFLQPGIAAGF